MVGLNTVFKKTFQELLTSKGYMKVKGRQPYFARMVGKEVVQVIAPKNVWCGEKGYKLFGILGVFDKVNNLKEYMDYLYTYNFSRLDISEYDEEKGMFNIYAHKEVYRKVLEILEERKENNLEKLSSCGLNI